MSKYEIDNMVEVTLSKADNFLVVKETLSRIGIASQKKKTIYQSCHILHKKGKYYILHFKELFGLDNRKTDFDQKDLDRKNYIINLLKDWGLIDIVDPSKLISSDNPVTDIKILSHTEAKKWTLVEKYPIGRFKTVS